MAKKSKLEPGTIIVHGFRKQKSSKSHDKKVKSAEKHLRDVRYSRESGKPMKGFKGLPKIIKVK